MLQNVDQLRPGDRIHDRKRERVLILDFLINPMGKSIPSYWSVRNERTNRKSVIREERLKGERWSLLP